MKPNEWRNRGRTHSFQGHGVFYREEGAGPALLCVHGFPTASWDWHRIWSRLTDRFRVIAPDMLGFGFSDKPRDHVYSIHEQASLHEDLLASLGVEEAHVLAHDYGDTVAQELLARHEERRRTGEPGLVIASCCFLNGGLFPELHRPLLIQTLLRSPIGFAVAALATRRTFRANLAKVFGPTSKPSEEDLDDLYQLVAHQNGLRIAHLLIRYIDDRREHETRWVGALERASVPLCLINGPEDPVSGLHAAEHFREFVPKADVVLLEGVGHYPQLEAPEPTLEAFERFHGRVASRRERA